jgi:predicted enzyme related to lactoylglutathione lyase
MRSQARKIWMTTLLLIGALPVSLLPARSEAAGEIYWFSLLSENVFTAMDFYTRLFGWEIATSPTGAYMATRNGIPFAGLNSIEDRMPGASESRWVPAITVDDLELAVTTAKSLGATIHQDVTNLPGWGRYALIQDPQGAPVLLVIPERLLGGTQGYSGWRWAELWTHDVAAATEFYTKVVGYEIEDVPVAEQSYRAFRSGDKRNAGIVQLEQPEIAARWMPYVGVTDLRAILVRVWQERGKVLREPSELEFEAAGANRVALIADPSGGAMFLYQLEGEAAVDPAVADLADVINNRSGPERSYRMNPNTRVTVSYGYGFGPGWGGAYPAYPYGPYGPRF